MMDPRKQMRFYLTWTFVLILFLLLSGLAIAGDLSYPKIKNIEPSEVN